MSLRVDSIDPASDPRWDLFVENHPLGLICHLSGWKKVLEKSFRHIRGRCLAILDGEGTRILAGLPIFQVRSRLIGNRLVSIPFATICDPLVSTGEEMEAIIRYALELYKETGNSYMELRTLMASSFVKGRGLGQAAFFKYHYLLLKPGPQEIQLRFHKTAVRDRIARALKSGLELRTGESENDLQSFFNLHKLTRKRLGLPCHPYVFLHNLWREFQPQGRVRVLLAMKNGNCVAGLIVLLFRNRVSVEFGASNPAFLDLSPNHFLYWKAILNACEEGYEIFDFGRTSPNNKGLLTFKRRWGTTEVDLNHFYHPESAAEKDQASESMAYNLVSMICRRAPNFLQQPIGEFCYRHLG